MSECVPSSLCCFFNFVILGPDDNFTPPNVTQVFNKEAPVPCAPPVRFSLDIESLWKNKDPLAEHDFDVAAFLCHHQDTTLQFGSEFRPIDQLRSIHSHHPNFCFQGKVWWHGMPCILSEELSGLEREQELMATLARGDHQSALADPEKN